LTLKFALFALEVFIKIFVTENKPNTSQCDRNTYAVVTRNVGSTTGEVHIHDISTGLLWGSPDISMENNGGVPTHQPDCYGEVPAYQPDCYGEVLTYQPENNGGVPTHQPDCYGEVPTYQ
jgi:hypothetical protein